MKRARSAADLQGPWTAWETEGIDEIQRIHAKYLKAVENQYIAMESCVDAHHIAIPYIVRGMDAYTKRSQKRAYKIMRRWKESRMPRGMLITISPRQVGSIYQLHRKMKTLWPKFTNFLRMYGVGRGVKRKYPYRGAMLWAVEPNERHYSHYHMMLGKKCKKNELKNVILSWWQAHGIDIEAPGVDVQHVRGDGKSYALKYVTKGCTDPVWSAMLWLDRSRAWGASRVLGDPMINSHGNLPRWTSATIGPIFLDRYSIPTWRYQGIIDGADVIKYITPTETLT